MDYTPQSFDMAVAKGEIPGHSSALVIGINPSISSSTCPEDLWTQGGLHTFLTEAKTLYLSSSNNTDNQNFKIIGLDSNYDLQIKYKTLTGQTQVAVDGTWIRINHIENMSTTETLGDVYLAESDSLSGGVPQTQSKIQAKALIADQQSFNGFYTVPAGHYALVRRFSGFLVPNADVLGAANTMRSSIFIRRFGECWKKWIDFGLVTHGSTLYDFINPHYIKVREKEDIQFRVCYSSNSNSCQCVNMMDLILVNEFESLSRPMPRI